MDKEEIEAEMQELWDVVCWCESDTYEANRYTELSSQLAELTLADNKDGS